MRTKMAGFLQELVPYKDEFQAVIMAAGRGSRMTELTVRTPKALLPIGNRPMVWYSVDMLERAGFTSAFIVVTRSALQDVKKTLEEIYPVMIRLEYVPISDNEESGTADSLRLIKDRIKVREEFCAYYTRTEEINATAKNVITVTDLLVVSCDLVTDVCLQHLADVHRTKDADLTMLLTRMPDISQVPVPCAKVHRKLERDFIGIVPDVDKVVFMKAESDCADTISVGRNVCRRNPHFVINSRLMDAHLYLMKRAVLDVLVEDRSINMIKAELIPKLLKKKLLPNTIDPEDDFDLKYQIERTSSSATNPSNNTEEKVFAKCYAHVLNEGLCIRANTLVTYCEANRQVAKKIAAENAEKASVSRPGQQASTDSLVGESVTMGEKAVIKSSAVGDHCNIKEHVKITNSVVMDHVTIDSGAVLSSCVIGANAQISEKVELKDCIVGSGQTVATGKYTNEVLMDANQMMEI